jgi:hypothetical protein
LLYNLDFSQMKLLTTKSNPIVTNCSQCSRRRSQCSRRRSKVVPHSPCCAHENRCENMKKIDKGLCCECSGSIKDWEQHCSERLEAKLEVAKYLGVWSRSGPRKNGAACNSPSSPPPLCLFRCVCTFDSGHDGPTSPRAGVFVMF